MIKALKKKYALSDQGAKDLIKGIVYSVLANISLMFPVILLAIVLNQLLAPVLGASAPEISAAVYTVIGIVILAVVFIFHYCQYTAAYLGTYDESARRRIGLAEKLRTLPLTFFHQRDLADLTSTIMGDCANFEHAFSHTVPQFFGDFQLANGPGSSLGSPDFICNRYSVTEMAGKTQQKAHERKTGACRRHSGVLGNRTGYKGLQSGRRLSSQIGRKDGCCGKSTDFIRNDNGKSADNRPDVFTARFGNGDCSR